MKFHSTNRTLKNGFKKAVSFKDALQMGIAPDNGLFLPTSIPTLSAEIIQAMRNKSYAEIAFTVLKPFLSEEISDEHLLRMCKEAYTFDIPIHKFDEKTFIARMDQGPTASFKDFAAQLMSRLMKYFKQDDAIHTVLAATSGDTGSAVGEAFRGVEGFTVYLLYPRNEISSIQKKHMDSIGKNVQAISVEGKFDDCQAFVKKAFLDVDLNKLNLTSANSINIGRLLPQIVYYFYIYSKMEVDEIVVCVPSGNFGSSFGCEVARRMGLPVKKILVATNENDCFPRFLNSGKYEKIDPSKQCVSNAMNVGNPSNLSRYFDVYSGNVEADGTVNELPDVDSMKENLFSVSVSDEKTVETIVKVYNEKKILLEPHGAVGIAGVEEYRKLDMESTIICLETAHPAKFPEIIEEKLGFSPELPVALKEVENREKRMVELGNDYDKVKQHLLNVD